MDVDPTAKPSRTDCAECMQIGGWWFHLRRCAAAPLRRCGHVGCCDLSPSQHATAHFKRTGHAVIQSFEPGEEWFWNYRLDAETVRPTPAPPTSHPSSQPTPGPEGTVPEDWMQQLN